MADNRDRREEYKRYYRENWERIQENRRRWKKRNPESNRAHKLKYAAANRDKEAARMRRWSKTNPEQASANVRSYKAKKRGAEGSHCAKDIEEILVLQGGFCVYCKIEISNGNKHIDHITPISRGGSNGPENLQVLCRTCNMRKHDKTHEEYLTFIGGAP